MLFYYDLLDSIIGVMSSLFGIVNSIRPFCILLCIYIFYYVLYSAILTWRFRLLWWCFALSIWQCKVLYPIEQFYILLCTYMSYHPTLGYFRNFCILFCVPELWSVSSCESKLYYAYVISYMARRMALSRQELDDRAGEWVSFSATLPFSAIRCQNGGQCDKRRIDKKTSSDQGLKFLREAKKLLSGSLSDNISLVNRTSIPNANRSERIASNLRALFSAYDDSPVSTRRPAPQSRK